MYPLRSQETADEAGPAGDFPRAFSPPFMVSSSFSVGGCQEHQDN